MKLKNCLNMFIFYLIVPQHQIQRLQGANSMDEIVCLFFLKNLTTLFSSNCWWEEHVYGATENHIRWLYWGWGIHMALSEYWKKMWSSQEITCSPLMPMHSDYFHATHAPLTTCGALSCKEEPWADQDPCSCEITLSTYITMQVDRSSTSCLLLEVKWEAPPHSAMPPYISNTDSWTANIIEL